MLLDLFEVVEVLVTEYTFSDEELETTPDNLSLLEINFLIISWDPRIVSWKKMSKIIIIFANINFFFGDKYSKNEQTKLKKVQCHPKLAGPSLGFSDIRGARICY